MAKAWSEWLAVADWLDRGWNSPHIPWAKGVYRFRVRPDHPVRGGEIVYIGRAGSHAGKASTALCSRVGSFITAAMGFCTYHAGGESFFNRSVQGGQQQPTHGLCVRDLEVSWVKDNDPMCREAEELASLSCLPPFNKQGAHGCARDECKRARKLRGDKRVQMSS